MNPSLVPQPPKRSKNTHFTGAALGHHLNMTDQHVAAALIQTSSHSIMSREASLDTIRTLRSPQPLPVHTMESMNRGRVPATNAPNLHRASQALLLTQNDQWHQQRQQLQLRLQRFQEQTANNRSVPGFALAEGTPPPASLLGQWNTPFNAHPTTYQINSMPRMLSNASETNIEHKHEEHQQRDTMNKLNLLLALQFNQANVSPQGALGYAQSIPTPLYSAPDTMGSIQSLWALQQQRQREAPSFELVTALRMNVLQDQSGTIPMTHPRVQETLLAATTNKAAHTLAPTMECPLSTRPINARASALGASQGHGTDDIPLCLPVAMARPSDLLKLSALQVLLRGQIQVFAATDDDVTTHVRGRNKTIRVGQVGIQCRHCAYLPIPLRHKGSSYFPTSVWGYYQASQNMITTHMYQGGCSVMPQTIKAEIVQLVAASKQGGSSMPSGAGRAYWAQAAEALGLVDMEGGVYFVRNVPTDLGPPKPSKVGGTCGVYRTSKRKLAQEVESK